MRHIKLLLLISFLVIIVSACENKYYLTENDLKVISELDFNKELLEELRSLTENPFAVKNQNPDLDFIFKDSLNYVEFANKGLRGLTLFETEKNALDIVYKLRKKYAENNYYIYISETNFGFSPDEITILKTNDKFDMLRFGGTNGTNHDIYVENIIGKLKIWDNAHGLIFFAVGNDFLEADLNQLPNDLDAYADELYEFCPDIVDQGTGTLELLKKEVVRTRKLYLWWD